MMDASKTLDSRDAYTVGWVAALSIELAATKLMLDERHLAPSDFDQTQDDQNTYIWGRIGQSRHNFRSDYSNSMLHSFPYIRVGLMVGIGAAIPRPEQGFDIRLGDVVVSQPHWTNRWSSPI